MTQEEIRAVDKYRDLLKHKREVEAEIASQVRVIAKILPDLRVSENHNYEKDDE